MTLHDVNALGAQMGQAYERGGHAAAEPYAARLLTVVGRWWLGTHPDALYLRARVRHVLAQAAADRGDHAAAREHIAAGLKAARRAARVHDPRVAFETVLLLTARADQHLLAGDTAAATADHDTALRLDDPLGHPMWWEARVHVHLGRATVRQRTGDLDGAEDDVRTALALASEHEPRLVSLCLDRLALLRRLAGADADAPAHAAEAVAATQPLDATRRAERARHAASVALARGDADAAGRHLDDAERAYLSVGDQRGAAAVGAVRGEVLRLRGDLAGAIDAAGAAVERCRAVGDPEAEADAYAVLGLALDEAGRGEEALAAHDRATQLATTPTDRVRVDVRRAVAAYNAALRTGASGTPEHDRAVDIAVPCALAADAVRYGLRPGELREAWAAEAARILDVALRTLTVAGREDEVLDLLEHVAASATLDPVVAEPGPGTDLLAVAPRVRTRPHGRSALAWALEAAQERYGVAVRGQEVVDAW